MSESRISIATQEKAKNLLNTLRGYVAPSSSALPVISNSSSLLNQGSSSSSSSSSASGTSSQSNEPSKPNELKEESDYSPSTPFTEALAAIDYVKSQSSEVLNAAYFLAMREPNGHEGEIALLRFANAYNFQAEARFELLPEQIYNEINSLVKHYRTLDQTLLSNEDMLKSKASSAKVDNAKIFSSSTRGGIGVASVLKTPPPVIKTEHIPYLDDGSLAAFARTSVFANKLAQDSLYQRKLPGSILGGEMAEVRKMLEAHPDLARERFTAEEVLTNKAGQRIQVQGKTPYHLALGEEDTEMAALFKGYIRYEQDADRQFHEQFPEGWETAEEKRWEENFTQLDTLAEAIRDAAPGEDINQPGHQQEFRLRVREGSDVDRALAEHRRLLDKRLNEVVTTGRHFNPKLLQRAFQRYVERLATYFGNRWDDPRALLFWQSVIGYIERLLPANYIQAFSDGIVKTTMKLKEGKPQGRVFTFEMLNVLFQTWSRVPLYPLCESLLGFDFAIYGGIREGGNGDGVAAKAARLPETGQLAFTWFSDLMSIKAKIMSSLSRTETLDLIPYTPQINIV